MSAAVVPEQTATPAGSVPSPAKPERLDAIDLLRGIVMVIMSLDHVRDFFSNFPEDPCDLEHTTPWMFLTRWITHYCAPTFVFLAGAGAFMYGSRGRSRRDVSWFLFSRGLWLIVLELTFVRFGWFFDLTYRATVVQVIWAIGWSMVVLSPLVYLPRWAILAFGLGMIVTHDMFNWVDATEMGDWRWLVKVLHEPGNIHVTGSHRVFVVYPLVPWIGVLATGYACGPLLTDREKVRRRGRLLVIGLVLIAAFVGLRYSNLYGDPHPWERQATPLFTFLSFINCEKYPASLLFLLMTLGPAILALPFLEQVRGRWVKPLVTLGRVPQFYYVLHLYMIHAAIAAFTIFRVGPIKAIQLAEGPFIPTEDHGYALWVVYLVWAGVVVSLYPACRWFAEVKRRHRDNVWLSYL